MLIKKLIPFYFFMQNLLLIFVPALLVGCGTSASRMTTPNGGAGFFVRCEDTKAGCFRKAIDICPAGYKILDSENISPTKNRSAYFEILIQCDSSWQNINRILKRKQ